LELRADIIVLGYTLPVRRFHGDVIHYGAAPTPCELDGKISLRGLADDLVFVLDCEWGRSAADVYGDHYFALAVR